jgi:hypothetical protein
MKNKDGLRFPLILAAVVLFSGLLVFSALTVRYAVQGAEKSEFDVLEYSLTHRIERGQNGDFTLTSEAQPGPCDT